MTVRKDPPGVEAEPPLYLLLEDESQRSILTAADISGFFVDPERAAPDLVDLAGVVPRTAALVGRHHDVALRVLDRRGAAIGSYYVGEVEVVGHQPGDRSVTASFFRYTQPFPDAGRIWRRWATGVPIRAGEWRAHPPESHASWLHVVQQAWFHSGKAATRYGTRTTHVVDGSVMVTIDSFYCALGEAVNGPGGYFGSNLNALVDCLRRPPGSPFRLVWDHFAGAEDRLGRYQVEPVLEVLRDHGAEVVLR